VDTTAPDVAAPETAEPDTAQSDIAQRDTADLAIAEPETAEPGYHSNKDAHLKRLRRIEGQVRGVQRMVEEDTYCIDVLTQISAATKALEAVALGLLDEHLRHCVTHAIQAGGAPAEDKLTEASAAIARLVRS
jgi:DNA-binding FrmR family transcriptional regulator